MSGVKSRVHVQSKLTAVSSRPTGPGKTHRLTALDHGMGYHTVHVIFYYRVNPFSDGQLESNMSNLRMSLAEVLCRYPPVTGRLARGEDGNWMVKCNDAGVRTVRATVGTTLDEWLRSDFGGAEERDLTVWEDMPDDDPSIWSPFQIQINEFEGGGIAIGLSCTHMLADPTSVTLLLKSWSDVHRGDPIQILPVLHHPPIFDRPITSCTKSTKYYSTKSKVGPTIMGTATFGFSHSVINGHLAQVHDKCMDATPFDLLAALFWTTIIRLKEEEKDPHTISICMDARNFMHEQIPYGYFGNLSHFSSLSLAAEELKDGGLVHVADMVHRHVERVGEEEFYSAVDWLESMKGEIGQYGPPFMMYGRDLTFVSTEHMIDKWGPTGSSCQPLMYSAMFEEGEKPEHVSYHVGNVEGEGEGMITVTPSPEKGLGRTVTVTLPEELIAKLCKDQAILSLDPTLVISGMIKSM